MTLLYLQHNRTLLECAMSLTPATSPLWDSFALSYFFYSRPPRYGTGVRARGWSPFRVRIRYPPIELTRLCCTLTLDAARRQQCRAVPLRIIRSAGHARGS
jgi:hypothetical protein